MHKRELLTFALVTAFSASAYAQDTCDVAEPMDDTRFFRRISIDLRGTGPSFEEINVVKDRGGIDEELIDAILENESFVAAMRPYHASLLWPNIDATPIVPDTHVLFPLEITPGNPPVYLSPVRSVFMRAVGNGAIFVPCLDEPAQFDGNGNIVATPLEVGGETVAMQEGWVEVEPYWAPGTTVRVCGFDAQPNVSATVCPGPVERYPFVEPTCNQFRQFANAVQAPFDGTTVDCNGRQAIFAPNCGCGPNLNYCQTQETGAIIRASLLEQELRVVDEVIREGRPYHEALTQKSVDFNGPIAHYLEHQATLSFDLEAAGDPDAPPPPIPYSDFQWIRVARTGRHAGVLTTPGYLLRFTTWRGRAHRFYNAFECSSFIPNGPLPSPQDPCSDHEDLTQRCGCDACHEALEPMAAHWGRFSEYGFRNLTETQFPRNGLGKCSPPLESVDALIDCFRQYELEPVGEEQAYAGQLNAYVFRSDDEARGVDEGPTRLVQQSLDSGRLSSCTVQKMWSHFMRRDPTQEEYETIIPELIAGFEGSGHDLKSVVKAIVMHPAYRRQP
ncbi:MAG: hypothetical protein RMA76_03150 [Deltaproteobacteria bacterium]|jgi:hypothetical protein